MNAFLKLTPETAEKIWVKNFRLGKRAPTPEQIRSLVAGNPPTAWARQWADAEKMSKRMTHTQKFTAAKANRTGSPIFSDLLAEWNRYAARERFTPTKDQRHVVESMLRLISDDRRIGRFFRARLTGVSTTMRHVEDFCRFAFKSK